MKRIIITLTLLALFVVTLSAQCTMKNTAIKDGEKISYNLYYNWQFVWVKAGTASLTTTETTYKGQRAFRSSLRTQTNQRLDKVFCMRDTLVGYSTLDLAPLYYRKGAREGNYYTVDEVSYSYPNGVCHAKMHRQKNNGKHVYETKTFENCLFDMVNMFQRARSFDATGWKKGHTQRFLIADGVKALPGKLTYKGRKTVKADNGKQYECLELSYIETENGKDKEIARFFVTDDDQHIPVRLDMNLKFGTAKAYLK